MKTQDKISKTGSGSMTWFLRASALAATICLLSPAKSSRAQPTAELSAERTAALSPEAMLRQAGVLQQNIRANVVLLQGLTQQAKEQLDIIKVNCTADKLSQATAHEKVAEQAVAALQIAVSKQDTGDAEHQFTRVTIIEQRVDVLASEGKSCIGAEGAHVGPLARTTTVDPNVRRDSQVTSPAPTVINVERPPVSSPF